MREPSFFEKAGRTLGDNYRRMADPNSRSNMRAKKARQNVVKAYDDFTSGIKGNTIQRGEGASGGGSGQVSDPSATYSGLGSFTAADEGTVTPKKEFGFGGENGDFDTFDSLTRGGNIGLGTKEDPFTGTNSRTSGFAEATPEDIAMRNQNTGDGQYASGLYGGDISRANAAYDLYRGEQMRQVAENDRNSSLHLEGIARKNAIQKQDRIRKSAFRDGGRMKGLSQRRRAEIAGNASDQMTELADQGARRGVASDIRDVGLADANSAKFTGQGQVARAQADMYKADSSAGVKYAEISSKEDIARQNRFTSPAQIDQHIANVIGKNEFPQGLLKDDNFMAQLRQHVSQGGDVLELADTYIKNGMVPRALGVEGA